MDLSCRSLPESINVGIRPEKIDCTSDEIGDGEPGGGRRGPELRLAGFSSTKETGPSSELLSLEIVGGFS